MRLHFWMKTLYLVRRRIKCSPLLNVILGSSFRQNFNKNSENGRESWERERARVERKESQLLNYIKLRMVVDMPFCRIYPILSNRRRSFYYLLCDSRSPRRVIIASGRTWKIAVFADPTWAFSRSVKLIARYYSHSTGWTVIRPDASRITTVRWPRMRQTCSFRAIENCFKA